MKATWIKSILFFGISLVVIFSAFAPKPAQAAACATYHWIQDGDTTSSIAKTYGITWKEIAETNYLKEPYVLREGVRLCIPEIRETAAIYKTATKGKISVMVIDNRVYIVASGFPDKGGYNVRVRDPEHREAGFTKIGTMKVPERKTVRGYFDLPAKFTDAEKLTVCIKNGTTDKVICQSVPHW